MMFVRQWRQVPLFEGIYEVSDDGMVRSVSRTISCSDGSTRKYPSCNLKPDFDKDGYMRVRLQNAGKTKKFGIHVLVARAFLGPQPPDSWVLHRDDNKINNDPDNLYYGSRQDNAKDAVQNGKQVMGERVATAKLVASDIPKIAAMRQGGCTLKHIGTVFGVTPQMIHMICAGKWWKHQLPRAGAMVPPRRA